MTGHVLDRPIWNALATRQTAFAIGGDRARRFVPDVGPLAGARDDDPASLAALAELVPADGTLLVLQVDPIVLPPGTCAVTTAAGLQLVCDRFVDVEPRPLLPIEPLAAADAPAMLALATLTKPGPFAARTCELGAFWGIKDGDTLLAMAGVRMHHPGYTEVSGVCTHPDARGRGFARMLSAHVARAIVARGETPYLHAYASNAPAIALYESLGFRTRSPVYVAAIARV